MKTQFTPKLLTLACSMALALSFTTVAHATDDTTVSAKSSTSVQASAHAQASVKGHEAARADAEAFSHCRRQSNLAAAGNEQGDRHDEGFRITEIQHNGIDWGCQKDQSVQD